MTKPDSDTSREAVEPDVSDAPIEMSTERPIDRIDGTQRTGDTDRLAVEEPVEIRLGNKPLAITMRTPGHDADLAAGFCVTEGLVRIADDLARVEPCALDDYGNVVIVTLSEAAANERTAAIDRAQRQSFLSSSCGVCGKESIDRIAQNIPPIDDNFAVSASLIALLPDKMRSAQATFDRTGGLHAAALFDCQGELLVLREDVGRHNAVDKVIGRMALLGRLPLNRTILLVSGRSSFEIMQKAAMAGIPMLCAVSAPSSLAVDFAQQTCQTLIGFLRGDRMNIYAHAQRISG